MSAAQGLANVGNTCGLNAVVQCLFHVPSFRKWFEARQVPSADADGPPRIVDELAQLFHDKIKYADQAIVPRRFTRAFQQRMAAVLAPGEQMDMSEVWTLLVDTMEGEMRGADACKPPWEAAGAVPEADAALAEALAEALAAMTAKATAAWARTMATVDPSFADLTTGLQVGQVVCRTCDRVYHNFETFTLVPLDIGERDQGTSVHLADCFKDYMKAEALNAGGAADWKCDACRAHTPVEKMTLFWHTPQVLVFVLKRFRFGGRGYEKITTPVDVPRRIEFGQVGGARPAYELRAMGCHFGTLDRGHCTAMCLDGDEWRHFDDEVAMPVPADRVLKNNAHAYMLFYEKV